MEYTEFDTRLAAYAVIVDDRDRLLLALWNEADRPQWTLPGGGVEWNESTEEGAVREVREETGYDAVLGRLAGVDVHHVAASDRLDPSARLLRSVRVVYEASVVGGDLRAEVDGTTDEARWWPLVEVPGLARVPLVDVALRMVGR